MVLAFAVATPVSATCFKEASEMYAVPSALLKAIARTESGMNALAINRNEDGSEDLGLMQINTRWMPTLKRYGFSRSDLWDACTNLKIGAWILAKNFAAYGYNWAAVGAYNAKSQSKRNQYAWKIYQAMGRVDAGETRNMVASK